jgi:uncharacterized protein (TIGR02266 family)
MALISHDDRRKHPRVPIGVIVRVQSASGIRRFYSRNISAGGVFLLAEDPIGEESDVGLEMYLPLVSTPVIARGEVVWIQRQLPSGFAVQFTEISEASRNLIRWVVERYMGSGQEP